MFKKYILSEFVLTVVFRGHMLQETIRPSGHAKHHIISQPRKPRSVISHACYILMHISIYKALEDLKLTCTLVYYRC